MADRDYRPWQERAGPPRSVVREKIVAQEKRIAELEETLKHVVLVLGGGDGDDPVALAKSIVAQLLAYEDHAK